jgi:hypothetical protein
MVEQATEQAHATTIDAVGLTVHDEGANKSLELLRNGSDIWRFKLENAIAHARTSVDAAFAWHLERAL